MNIANWENILVKGEKFDIYKNATAKIAEAIAIKKYEIFLACLKELKIEFDPEKEHNKRFKSFIREISGNEEAIYYNNGPGDGLRVVTFVENQEYYEILSRSLMSIDKVISEIKINYY